MTIATTKMTADEFMELPEVQGERWELVDGEIIVSPRPNLEHMFTAGRLYSLLDAWVENTKLGIVYLEIDTKFDTFNARSPDIQFYNNAHSIQEIKKNRDITPTLCVEILSPFNVRTDRVDKFKLFQKRGVAHYWIVDPLARTIESHVLENGQYVAKARGADQQVIQLEPFPGLDIHLGRLWHP